MNIYSEKIITLLTVAFLFFAGSGLNAAEGEKGTNYEIAEWSFIAVIAVSGFAVDSSGVWADEPLIGGPSDKEYHDSTVPTSWLYIAGGAAGAGIGLLPNNEGWLNGTSYRNFKGFLESSMLTMLATGITKNGIGRKRPSHDNYPESEKDDSRKSFISGHSSGAFSIAGYSSFYILQHMGDADNPLHLTGKITAAVSLLGLASYTAWTRVEDNKHHLSDIIAGGATGLGISWIVYAFQNDLFPWGGGKPGTGDVAFNFYADGENYSVNALMRF